jgi:hypothetical protein
MSQENVELARRGMESPDAFWALLDEHVVGDTRDFPLPDFPAIGGRTGPCYRGHPPLLGHLGRVPT